RIHKTLPLFVSLAPSSLNTSQRTASSARRRVLLEKLLHASIVCLSPNWMSPSPLMEGVRVAIL
ncbi:MAG: hypothetical protein PVI07_07435, partial [Anaerolineae bacterium]